MDKDTSPSSKSSRYPKAQIFVEIFCTNLQSPEWSRHVGLPTLVKVRMLNKLFGPYVGYHTTLRQP